MKEVPYAGKHHGQIEFVRRRNDLVIADRAPGLNNGGDAMLGTRFYAIGERKKASDAITEPLVSSPASLALIAAIRVL